MTMMRIAALVLVFLVSGCAMSRAIEVTTASGDTGLTVVSPRPRLLSCAAQSGLLWQLREGRLVLTDVDERPANVRPHPFGARAPSGVVHEVNLPGGRRLVGVDAGEYGGQVLVLDADGTPHSTEINTGRVVGLFALGPNEVAIISASRSKGRLDLLAVDPTSGVRIARTHELQSIPLAVGERSDGAILIASRDVITAMNRDLTVNKTFRLPSDFAAVGITSLLPVGENSVWIGGHLLVAHIDYQYDAIQISWFLPDACKLGRACCAPEPDLGIYLQPDPAHATGVKSFAGPQAYTYAGGRPLVWTDPLGRWITLENRSPKSLDLSPNTVRSLAHQRILMSQRVVSWFNQILAAKSNSIGGLMVGPTHVPVYVMDPPGDFPGASEGQTRWDGVFQGSWAGQPDQSCALSSRLFTSSLGCSDNVDSRQAVTKFIHELAHWADAYALGHPSDPHGFTDTGYYVESLIDW